MIQSQAVPVVRHATRSDLPRVAELAIAHAVYEQADPPAAGFAERLADALFDRPEPRLICLVAELGDGSLAGYATCTPEFATWSGHEYLHMDCLFLDGDHRGLGLGRLLIDAVAAEAVALGLEEVQWNTPVWNEGAIRFYDRLGATSREKRRYAWTVPAGAGAPRAVSSS
ncbi:GNAT family N-acetyltransferase [Streptomyces sp. H39-S7]|uniref:GNAT family N-acetyltransferase n=1 Tax=Streptomyces sp. H39-S7 TaxID=3004357 RepID=UPI0022AF0CCA|nr:GNAT family N-acetyltransferase [Streptomyces sp. H39-S7]MCZ4124522.1 GNAT family N-acetyltransferase [Streptomyces sp. H39-S7]